MTGERPRRSDFFEPVWGWQIWRRGAKRAIAGWAAGEAQPRSDAPVDDVAPDYVEPVIGWRVWRAVKCKGEYYLASVFNNVVWLPGSSFDAQCLAYFHAARHRAPDPECCCGVYASRWETLDWQFVRRGMIAPVVVGSVSLWGPVVEAERGWRAEHAYPERLFVPSFGDSLKERDFAVAASLRAYGVPVANVLVGSESSLMPSIAVVAASDS